MIFNYTTSNSQVEFISCGSNGELILSTATGCCQNSLGTYEAFVDIAITPDGRIFGLNGVIYNIDTISRTYSLVSTPLDQNGNNCSGVGLVALNNDYLLSDRDDSLFLIEIYSGTSTNLGKIGYYCNGDFAFLNGDLYMSSDINELIKIKLDNSNFNVISVENKGVMSPSGAVYSLFSNYTNYQFTEKYLFAIDGYSIYKVDTSNASMNYYCSFDTTHISYGGASLYDFDVNQINQVVPNVFTPNSDNINDIFILPYKHNLKKLIIYNRWGQVVFEGATGENEWNGQNLSGVPVPDGVYFYLIELIGCENGTSINGYVTLMR